MRYVSQWNHIGFNVGKQTGDQERKKGNRAFRICCGTYDSRGQGPELGSIVRTMMMTM